MVVLARGMVERHRGQLGNREKRVGALGPEVAGGPGVHLGGGQQVSLDLTSAPAAGVGGQHGQQRHRSRANPVIQDACGNLLG